MIPEAVVERDWDGNGVDEDEEPEDADAELARAEGVVERRRLGCVGEGVVGQCGCGWGRHLGDVMMS